MSESANAFPGLCRQWRQQRGLSLLALATAASVSQRHLSWLESGRSRPSCAMVLRLAEAMSLPLREQNRLLQAAGYAPRYLESLLDAPCMELVNDALHKILSHHLPYPALVLDRHWNWVTGNAAAEYLLDLAGVSLTESAFNLAEATLSESGLLRYVRNRETALPQFLQRLRYEASVRGDTAFLSRIESLARQLALPQPDEQVDYEPLLPVIPLVLDFKGVQLSLFTVLSTFGTPQDLTTDELRIESFYPADSQTREFFLDIGSQNAPE